MVTTITSFGRSGLYDWMFQRATAVVLLFYTIFIIGYLLFNPDLDYLQWKTLFEMTWVRVFTLLTLLSIGAHAWIGLWSISTDYIKPTGLRFIFQGVCGAAMFTYLVWGVQILWGL
jgi:succinate dehydrogenase / fumarate reductase membrane anchor subunit